MQVAVSNQIVAWRDLLGFARYIMLKPSTTCKKFPDSRFHVQLDLGDFAIAFGEG
jgi:hypothetical protein